MSLRVFAWDSNPAVDSHSHRISNSRAEDLVSRGFAEFVTCPDGRRAIQKKATPEQKMAKAIGLNNLVPFGRTYNPLLHPTALHYEVPHAGDCRSICLRRFGMRRHKLDTVADPRFGPLGRRIIQVSKKKIDFAAAARARTA